MQIQATNQQLWNHLTYSNQTDLLNSWSEDAVTQKKWDPQIIRMYDVTPSHRKCLSPFFSLSPLTSRGGWWLLQTFVAWHLHRDSIRTRIRHLHHHCHSGASGGHSGVFQPIVLTRDTFITAQTHPCVGFSLLLKPHSLSILLNSCIFTWKRHRNQTRKRSTTAAGGTSRLPRPTRSSAPDEAQTITSTTHTPALHNTRKI